jgi:putative heme transporter
MSAMVAENPDGPRRRWWHRGPFVRREVRWSVGLVLLFLFVFYIALPLLASHRQDLTALGHIHPAYLILGTVLEIGALAAYTQLTYAVLPKNGPRRLRLFRINMSTLALSHVSPGGTAPGAALGYRLLTQSGVSGSDTGFALGTQGIGSAVVLNVLFWLALVAFVLIHGFHVPTSHQGGQSQSGTILVVVAAAIGVVLLGAFGGLFYLLTRGQERAASVVRRISGRLRFLDPDKTAATVQRLAQRFAVLLEDRPLLIRAVTWATINWVLDAASLWVFVAAFSHFISPIDLLVAYGLANILAAIPITPGGLGVVEFVLVSMITGFGPTAGQALSGVLAYRAINFWLPIPFGGMAYTSLEFERGNLYRRLHLFFLDRYQRRRGALGVEDEAVAVEDETDGRPASRTATEPAGGSHPRAAAAASRGTEQAKATPTEQKAEPTERTTAPAAATGARAEPEGAPTDRPEAAVDGSGAPGDSGPAATSKSPLDPGWTDTGWTNGKDPAGGATTRSGAPNGADGGSHEAEAEPPAATGHVHRFRRRSAQVKSEKKGAFAPQSDASRRGGKANGTEVQPPADPAA